MRFASIVSYLSALLISACCSAALPITMMAGTPPPTTAPVDPTSVLLLPFQPLGQSADNGWISEAIEEDLSHDLSRNAAIRVIRPATTQPASNVPGAQVDGLNTARAANADRLISGSYQVVDDQLRVTANVLDLSQNKTVGEIKATGRVRDLFQIEDSLAMQLWHILPRPAAEATASASDIQVTPLEDYVAEQQPPPQIEQQPVDVSPAPVYDNTPDNVYDNTGYPYGGYAYGYPYGFGYPLFIYGGYGYHGGYNGGYHGGYHGGGGHFTGGGHIAGGARVFSGAHTETPHFAGAAEHAGGGMAFGAHR